MNSEFITRPLVVTIAGSDPVAGAGIQTDLKAFNAINVYGTSVITCITAQNTKGVQAIEPLSKEIISAQLDSVLNDVRPRVIKTGMLYSAEIVSLITEKIKEYQKLIVSKKGVEKIQLVVDPVMSATTGGSLANLDHEFDRFLDSIKNSLIPIATIITPNVHEAEKLIRHTVKTSEDVKNALEKLARLGASYVLLKGGHIQEAKTSGMNTIESVDYLYNRDLQKFSAQRYSKDVHGTGCTFASLIAGGLVKGFSVPQAVELAKRIVTSGIKNSLEIGDGVDVVNVSIEQFDYRILNEIEIQLSLAINKLVNILEPYFIPEVGINIGYSKLNAVDTNDICALTGRIIRVGNQAKCYGTVQFGASKHVARIILTVMDRDKDFRSAMNIKYKPDIIERCKEVGFSTGSFDRLNEPGDTSSMEWGTKTVIDDLGYVPDIIFDNGGIGKEPMIRILGKNPEDVLIKLEQIIKVKS